MTPIDPTDVPELLRIYEAGATRRSAERDGIAWMETHKGLLAVARAVCPEHHAVFDTRTHVAVPIEEIEDHAEKLVSAAAFPSQEMENAVFEVEEWLCCLRPDEWLIARQEAAND